MQPARFTRPSAASVMFQSSPVPEDGCNMQYATKPALTAGFNPHTSRRTGATLRACDSLVTKARFQSSPVPEDGCNRCW